MVSVLLRILLASNKVSDAALLANDRQVYRQPKNVDDSKEVNSTQENISLIQRSKRRRKRNRNSRGGSRIPSGGKCSRFIDFDAPH